MSSCKNPTDYIRKNQRHVEYIGSYRTDFDKMYLAKYAPDDMRVVRGGMPTRVGISALQNEPVGGVGGNVGEHKSMGCHCCSQGTGPLPPSQWGKPCTQDSQCPGTGCNEIAGMKGSWNCENTTKCGSGPQPGPSPSPFHPGQPAGWSKCSDIGCDDPPCASPCTLWESNYNKWTCYDKEGVCTKDYGTAFCPEPWPGTKCTHD